MGRIGSGLVALVAVEHEDGPAVAEKAAEKLATLRCFPDDRGRMNLDAGQAGAGFLVVSQFTLAANLSRGRRPSFEAAADSESARGVIDLVVRGLSERGFEVATGEFGAHMEVELTNDGPVTFLLDF